MNKLYFLVLFVVIAISCHADERVEAPTSLPRDLITQPKSILEIDLTSCNCVSFEYADCEIAISKSSVLEIHCSQDEVYCCKGSTKYAPNVTENGVKSLSTDAIDSNHKSDKLTYPQVSSWTSETRSIKDKPRFRLIPILDTYSKEEKEEGHTKTQVAPKSKKCLCKPRDQCAEEYRDYRFGFHCTYNTTRCCEPEMEVFRETEGHVLPRVPILPDEDLIVQSEEKMDTENSNGDHYHSNSKCQCLPREECFLEKENLIIWRRQDTFCLENLIQCCGEGLKSPAYEDGDEYDELLTPAAEDGSYGQQQPIPLPQLKIPVTEEADSDTQFTTSTLAPPQLPTYYNYHPPKYYSGYYYPTYTAPRPILESGNDGQLDQGHVEQPLLREYVPASDRIPLGNRGYRPVPVDHSRTIFSEESLFEKLSKILG